MLNEYGAAMRGDWGSIDGRGVRSNLGDVAGWITSRPYPGDEKARERLGLCPAGWGHWVDHCDEGGCEPLSRPVAGEQS
jgi:hypothetical protein